MFKLTLMLLIFALTYIFNVIHHSQKSNSRSIASEYIPTRPSSFFSTYHSFMDDFTGPGENDDPRCFSRPPVCMKAYNGHWNCEAKEANLSGLKSLNKCNWAIELFSTNKYSVARAENVVVKPAEPTDGGKGVLYLYSRKNPNFSGNVNGSKIETSNCGESIDPADPYRYGYSDDCPYYVGHLWSKPRKGDAYFEGLPGFSQKYGRFEVRAKLQNNDLNFPAFWLVPADKDNISASWPRDGEIDIMEQFSPDEIGGSYHGATEASKKKNRHDNITVKYKRSASFFANEWHTYAVEWLPGELKFYVDNINYASFKTGENIYKDGITTKRKTFILPGSSHIDESLEWHPRDFPFFWRINSAIADSKMELSSEFRKFQDSAVLVDYVKTFKMCVEEKDFCPFGGNYISTPGLERCELFKIPSSKIPQLQGNDLFFEDPECEGGKCKVYSYLGKDKLFLEDGFLKTIPTCANFNNAKKDFSASSDIGKYDPGSNSPKILNRYPVPYYSDTIGGLKIEFNVPRPMEIRFLLYDIGGRFIGSLPMDGWKYYEDGVFIEGWNIDSHFGLSSAPYIITMQWKIDGGPIQQTPGKENHLGKIIYIRN